MRGLNCPDWLCFFGQGGDERGWLSRVHVSGFVGAADGVEVVEAVLTRLRPDGKRAEPSERGFGGISGMGWDCWPGAGPGWGSRVGREGRHKACPYGGGSGDDVGDAGATRGRAQGLPLPEGLGSGGSSAETTRGQAQGLPLHEGFGGLAEVAPGRREGRHKACPYGERGRLGAVWGCGPGRT